VALTPVETVRRAFEIWATRDFDAMRKLYDPEVVYDCSLRVLNAEVYFGHDGLERLTEEVDAIWAQFDIEFEDLIEVDRERVIALMTSDARGRASGVELTDTDAATTFTVRGGKIVHAKLYPDRADAFAEAGVSPPGK
jgi:ketosteroid isomerase-like protein